MLRYLQIENFKSLKGLSLPMEGLNLYFGMNGMGKSSVIQSLLLLRQSYWDRNQRSISGLKINGELIDLGTSMDILCHNAETDRIRLVACFDEDKKLDISFQNEIGQPPTETMKVLESVSDDVSFCTEEPLFNKNFCYLGADHISPRKEYSSVHWDVDGPNVLGSHGEFAVPYLAIYGDSIRVPEELCLASGKTNRLYDQVSAWMSEISPGVKLSATFQPYEQRAKLYIRYAGQRLDSTPFLPMNVGFGIPYVLPMVIALLVSGSDGLLMIENPESHLHPRGQARMAELIARVAARGTQIICESHSDHVINSIRVAVKNKVLSEHKLSVVYFDKDEDQNTKTTEIAIDCNGNLSDYPQGLLDEWGILMSALL